MERANLRLAPFLDLGGRLNGGRVELRAPEGAVHLAARARSTSSCPTAHGGEPIIRTAFASTHESPAAPPAPGPRSARPVPARMPARRAAQELHGVRDHREHGRERLPDALRAPGEVEDQRRSQRAPATARESAAIGVCASPVARISSARPGASRSITARVASGVTSRGPKPVPPVVTTSPFAAGQLPERRLDLRSLVRDHARDRHLEPRFAEQLRPPRHRTRPLGCPA